MKFPIDASGLMVLVAEPPAQRKDFESGALKTTEDGRPVFSVRVLIMDGQESAPLRVTVNGDPQVSAMQPVALVGLTINIMDKKGDSMSWWTAERVEPVGPPLLSSGDGAGAGRGARAGKADA